MRADISLFNQFDERSAVVNALDCLGKYGGGADDGKPAAELTVA